MIQDLLRYVAPCIIVITVGLNYKTIIIQIQRRLTQITNGVWSLADSQYAADPVLAAQLGTYFVNLWQSAIQLFL